MMERNHHPDSPTTSSNKFKLENVVLKLKKEGFLVMFKMGHSFFKFNSGISPQFASNLAPHKTQEGGLKKEKRLKLKERTKTGLNIYIYISLQSLNFTNVLLVKILGGKRRDALSLLCLLLIWTERVKRRTSS